MVPSDLLEHCRLCLVKECVSVNIFENDSEIRQLYYKIVATLPVQISRQDDKLPKKICRNCNLKVDELYQFWSITANSQKTLLRWLHEAEESTTLTKIKCEYDADAPLSRNLGTGSIRMKVEPEDNSSDDDRGVREEHFDDDHYRDDSDLPDDGDLLPTNIVNVSLKDGDGGMEITNVERKPKKFSSGGKKKSSSGEGSSGLNLLNNENTSSWQEEDGDSEDDEKPNIFSCIECNEKFINGKEFVSHLRSHNVPSHVCDICSNNYPSADELAQHFLSHLTSDGLYQCDECEFVGKRLTHLKTHKKLHEKVYGIYCDICGQGFYHDKEVTLHKIKDHDAFPYQCDICHKIFTNKSSMWSHKKLHNPEDQIPWECEHCHKVYNSKRSYKRHMKVHLGVKHDCTICQKKLSSKQHLRLHMVTHSKEKPMMCSVCGKGFKRKDYLNEHMRIHTGDRPFKCEMCGKGFTQKQALNTHILSHTKEKPFQCVLCTDRFITKTLVRYHLKSHHGLDASTLEQPQFSYFDDNV